MRKLCLRILTWLLGEDVRACIEKAVNGQMRGVVEERHKRVSKYLGRLDRACGRLGIVTNVGMNGGELRKAITDAGIKLPRKVTLKGATEMLEREAAKR